MGIRTGGDGAAKRIGVKKEIDPAGRPVIPREMRELFALEYRVERVVTEEGILLRKPSDRLVKTEK